MRFIPVAGAVLALLPSAVFAQVTLDGHRLVLQQTPAFKPGSAVLTPKGEASLSPVAQWLTEKTYISTLRVEGHVANAPAAQAQMLSESRARSIAAALVRRGIDCTRLHLVGFGDTKPVAPKGGQANTRIEFVNAALRGRTIGGLPLDGGGRPAGSACP